MSRIKATNFVTLLGLAMNFVARRMPTSVACVGMAKTQWRKLVARIPRTSLLGNAVNREAIEKEELFDGQYTLISKSDTFYH